MYIMFEMFLRHESGNVWRHLDMLIWISHLAEECVYVCVCWGGAAAELRDP